jgi:tRNA G26 N,N-dimethylase Trm1
VVASWACECTHRHLSVQPMNENAQRMGANARRRLKENLRYPAFCPNCLTKTSRSLLRDLSRRCDACGHVTRADAEGSESSD